MLIVGCDLCNTIADINTRLFAMTGMRDTTNYPFPLPRNFFTANPDIFLAARPFKGAPEILRHLANQGAQIHYITARPEWAREITTKWLSRHGFPVGKIHMGQPKKDVVKEYNIKFMLEDHPGEIMAIKDLCHVLVRAQPYNVGHPNRFTHWGQVVSLIQNIMEVPTMQERQAKRIQECKKSNCIYLKDCAQKWGSDCTRLDGRRVPRGLSPSQHYPGYRPTIYTVSGNA